MIKIYGKPNCPKCNLISNIFQKNNINHIKINIISKKDKIKEYKDKGIYSLPIIEDKEGNFLFNDFKTDKIKNIIEKYNN